MTQNKLIIWRLRYQLLSEYFRGYTPINYNKFCSSGTKRDTHFLAYSTTISCCFQACIYAFRNVYEVYFKLYTSFLRWNNSFFLLCITFPLDFLVILFTFVWFHFVLMFFSVASLSENLTFHFKCQSQGLVVVSINSILLL